MVYNPIVLHWQSLPSCFLMKKNDDANSDLEGRMYPFFNCLSIKASNASSSVLDIGYILQSIASRVPGLNVISWSQGLDGGSSFDSSSLNTFANRSYSFGIRISFLTPAAIARSVAIEAIQLSFDRLRAMLCFSASVRRWATTGLILAILGLTVRITIGKFCSSIVPCSS